MGGRQLLFRSIIHHTTTNLANTFARTMKPGPNLDGCFAINKPPAISSAQVIRNVQKHFNPSRMFKPWMDAEQSRKEANLRKAQKKSRKDRQPASVKMGHGGTLDPLATGVLVLGVGNGTKSLNKLLECTKSYETVLLFGAATDTYDTEGRIVARKPYEHVTRQMVEEALANYRGKIMQRPPIYSALRVQGKRLYEYAREGKEVPVEIKERPVEVLELDVVEWMEGRTHKWHWPTAEAEAKEMEFAENVLNLNGTDKQEKSESNTKVEDMGIVEERTSEIEAAKATSDTEMSGALPSDSAIHTDTTPDASSKRKRYDDETANGTVVDAPSAKRAKSLSDVEGDSTPAQPRHEVLSAAPASTSEGTAPPLDDSLALPSRPPCPAPAVRIRMTVTSGFYVRSLCHDLGAAVGSLGIMASLVRSRQADFQLGTNVLEYEDLAAGEEVWAPKVQEMLKDWQTKAKLEEDQMQVKNSIEGGQGKTAQGRTDEEFGERVRARRNTSSAEG